MPDSSRQPPSPGSVTVHEFDNHVRRRVDQIIASVFVLLPVVSLPMLRNAAPQFTFFAFLVSWGVASMFLTRRYGAELQYDALARTITVTTYRVFSKQREHFSPRELARVEVVRHGAAGALYSLRLVMRGAMAGPVPGPERTLVLDRSTDGNQLRAAREAIAVFFSENEMDQIAQQLRLHSDS